MEMPFISIETRCTVR